MLILSEALASKRCCPFPRQLKTFNAFNIIYLVNKNDPDGSTEILVTEAYKWAFERQYQYGYVVVYAMVVFAILVLYSKLTQFVLEDNKA